ncbi:ferredoxin reductase family protein [Hyphomicrobium sp.]|uniref:ferredoxin reductase family protein n=1 Tax=Hyphomicrobium sp. TaxID=82 RepID=UPI002D78E9C7|nr:ferric reductase-like transmembrane domain-containing protein [Hyphomicrobium sp.]
MQLARLWTVFMACVVALAVLWLLSLAPGAFTGGFWLTRRTLVYGSGVLAIGLMSVGVILAARPVWFETPLGGLDKFYRLHKWLGIGAFAFAIAHWLIRMGPSWITKLSLFELPPRPARGAPPVQAPPGFDVFRDLREPAAHVGEWTFYLLAILVLLALWKRFPYKYFFKTHKLMPAVYLVLVFHTFILMDLSYWTKPIGPALAVLLSAGSVAALVSLSQKIGYLRKASGRVMNVRLYENNLLEVTVKLETAWRGHEAGQFAFVNFDDPEDAHPFTISSPWRDDGLLTFTIKGLGDYTRTLASTLYVGQGVVVEGPYGRFNFPDDHRRQIWIGGGVGITPFIARLKALAQQGSIRRQVDLFYATSTQEEDFIKYLRELAEKAGVRFHVLVESAHGRLTLDRLEALAPYWKDADILFCGPLEFGRAMRDPMVAQGLPPSQFHQELFDMR